MTRAHTIFSASYRITPAFDRAMTDAQAGAGAFRLGLRDQKSNPTALVATSACHP